MHIEQAIFTSADTDRAQGYQLASRSGGLSDSDARELALWGPSHDSLLDRPGESVSTNFHRLASGAYCISRTTLEGAEYSGRGGPRVYTHFLVVPGDVLARFANNPFAVLRAAMASGALGPRQQVPPELPTLRLGGRAPVVDLGILARLACDPGPRGVATLVQAALSSDRLAVASRLPTEQLLAGLFSVLPVECRIELSFSTGLKLSPTRNVRLVALSRNRNTWKSVARNGVTLVDIDAPEAAETVRWDGWAGCVAEILNSGKLSVLAAELQQARPGLSCAGVDEISESVRARLAEGGREDAAAAETPQPASPQPAYIGERTRTEERLDAPHRRAERVLTAAAAHVARSAVNDLAEALAAQPPKILELLERIDDVVFAAIDGDARALAELEVLWPLAADELDEDLFEQSREQYLRCALSICTDCVDGEIKRPERALAAVEVLCVLFEE